MTSCSTCAVCARASGRRAAVGGRGRRQLRAAPRTHDGACRRIRLGQVGDGAVDHGPDRSARPRRSRARCCITGAICVQRGRTRDAARARRAHRHGVPGPADLAEPRADRSAARSPRPSWRTSRLPRRGRWRARCTLLERVGVADAARRARDYPHHFSGGMRQRVLIAAAIACRPDIIIADEPTTALDVTVQAKILRLLHDLQQEMQASLLLITHDLGVVAAMADDVLVMYAGRVVEHADVDTLFHAPRHPYTRALLACVLASRMIAARRWCRSRARRPICATPPPGCRFAPRCPHRRCRHARCGKPRRCAGPPRTMWPASVPRRRWPMPEALLRVEGLSASVSRARGCGLFRRPVRARSRMRASRCGAAKRWVWSAKAAAANRRWRAWCCT